MGCGAIGGELAGAICAGRAGAASVTALFDVAAGATERLSRQLPSPVTCHSSFDSFLTHPGLQLVVESAPQDAVRADAASVLAAGKDMIVMSAGTLVDEDLFLGLARLCEGTGSRLMIPSGALGGIDAIRASRPHLRAVTLTTTKPPRALQGSPGFRDWEAGNLAQAAVVFEGPALEAVRLFPANVNVAATLSLAGLGPEQTVVRIVADPAAEGNTHEIEAVGAFGVMRFTLENQPHPDNARTSYLAVLAALETLRAACSAEPRVGT